ncbi:MAG TPA: hypothetical protein VG406_13750 [Isosphaeraceae bacterium]|jgi:hypothetical protein|nr:hypothetical protein [Isosphaeraceae bacterium]
MDGPTAAYILAPWPDDALDYAPLPVSGDDGFPQMFLIDMQGVVYRITLTVIYSDPAYVLDPDYEGAVYELPDPDLGLYLDLRVEREDLPDPGRLLGVRRVVLDMPIAFGPLRLRFSRVRVARGNLVQPGKFGSELVADVAVTDV